MKDLLALLLRPELPNVQKELPTAEYRVKRLSEALGTDVVFKLRALPYGKVKSIRDSVAGDPGLDILLAGCVEPDLKAKELKEKYGGATPAETVKAMLLPGEIEDLSRAVERLCGFHKHHWTPEMYYGMGQGGRDLTLAFALHEVEEGREPR